MARPACGASRRSSRLRRGPSAHRGKNRGILVVDLGLKSTNPAVYSTINTSLYSLIINFYIYILFLMLATVAQVMQSWDGLRML